MKAFVFAAGIGSRLGEITKSCPKCLVEAGGKTLLEHVIVNLKRAGVSSIAINLHHLADQIRTFIAANQNFGLEIEYSFEEKLLETGGGLRKMQGSFQNEPCFLVHNSDIYSEIDLKRVVDSHLKEQAIATLLVMQRETTRGLLFNRAGQFVGWRNPDKERLVQGLETEETIPIKRAFCGIQVLSPRIFNYLASNTPAFSIIEGYLNAASNGEKVREYLVQDEYWIDIGKPETLNELRRKLTN